jgi:hypothetical protein
MYLSFGKENENIQEYLNAIQERHEQKISGKCLFQLTPSPSLPERGAQHSNYFAIKPVPYNQ